jgi:hypothetical protein
MPNCDTLRGPFADVPEASELRHVMLDRCDALIRRYYGEAKAAGFEHPFIVLANATDSIGRELAVSLSGEAKVEGTVANIKAAYDGGYRLPNSGEVPRPMLFYVFEHPGCPGLEQPPSDSEFPTLVADYSGFDTWYLAVEA